MYKLEKIKWVESNIKSYLEHHSNHHPERDLKDGFLYSADSLTEGNKEIISQEEHERILRYLERKGRVEIIPEKGWKYILILNDIDSILDRKTLEFVAKKIGDLDSGLNLVDRMEKVGIKKWMIIYPNTKWRMLYDIFLELSISTSSQDHEILFRFIEEFIHPLMHNGDFKKAEEFENDLNKLLVYDGYKSKGMKIIRDEEDLDSFVNYIVNKRDGFEPENNTGKKLTNNIKKITIIKPESGYRYRFYLNDDIEEVKFINNKPNWLKDLLKIKEFGEVDFNKTTFDYLNSNRNSAFYSSGKYNLSNILVELTGDRKNKMNLSQDVNLKLTTSRAYKRVENKINKR